MGTPSPTYSFQFAYALEAWVLEGNDRGANLTSRGSASCTLMVQPVGEWGGPAVTDQMALAGLDWRTTYWIADGAVFYVPQLGRSGPWFVVAAGLQAPAAAVESCRKAAEEVLGTFAMR